ncbi:MAG: hypothetical protein HKO14_11305 [Silicimonas sp.]|nr:hypothetical protein [Silicimonas sp.]
MDSDLKYLPHLIFLAAPLLVYFFVEGLLLEGVLDSHKENRGQGKRLYAEGKRKALATIYAVGGLSLVLALASIILARSHLSTLVGDPFIFFYLAYFLIISFIAAIPAACIKTINKIVQ